MIYIQAQLTDEEDSILQKVADREGRSKRQQLKISALAHARSVLNPVPHNEDDTEGGEV